MKDIPILFTAPMVQAIIREIEAPGEGKLETRRTLKWQPHGPLKVGDQVMGLPGMFVAGDVIWPLGIGHSVVSNKPGPHPEWVAKVVKWKTGDRLWVRENWRVGRRYDGVKPRDLEPRRMTVLFEAGGSVSNGPTPRPLVGPVSSGAVWGPTSFPLLGEALPDWASEKLRPAIHMPRWMSRLTLVVSEVKVERLQEISEEAAHREGITSVSRQLFNMNGYGLAGTPPEEASPTRVAAFSKLWRSIEGTASWDANPYVAAIRFTPHLCNIDAME